MRKVFLLYVAAFCLFVSCKRRNSVHEQPLVNIDSLKSVSKNVLNIDTAVYRKEMIEFLNQIFPVTEKNNAGLIKTIPFILSDSILYTIEDKRKDYILKDSENLSKSEIQTFFGSLKNHDLKMWNNNIIRKATIIPQGKIDDIFSNKTKGWMYFYKQYGYGFYRLSIPVFLRNYTYCILLEERYFGWEDGHKSLEYYKKKNDKWIRVKTFRLINVY